MEPESIIESDNIKYGKVHAVLLSYFHRITGPCSIFEYPPNHIDENIRDDIAQIMDLEAEPKIFTHKSGEITTINNFFEISSKWARGGKERVMISIIFLGNVSSNIENVLKPFLQDFEQQLVNTDGIFKGFYSVEEFDFTASNEQSIQAMKNQLKSWITHLFSIIQSCLIEDWVIKQMPEFTLLPDDQIPLIRKFIRPEGLQLLERISQGPIIRDELSHKTKNQHLPIAGTIPLLISLDLITEGSELVITNRGRKVINTLNIHPKRSIKEVEPHVWQEVFGEKGINVLLAIRDGKTKETLERQYPELSTILKMLWNYHLIIENPELKLTPYGQKLLKFTEEMNKL